MLLKQLLKYCLIGLILLNFNRGDVFANNKDNKSAPDEQKLFILGASSALVFIYAYGIENTMWWKGEKSSFHFNWQQDWTYALGADKFGHFFFGYFLSSLYSRGLQWCNINLQKSLLYSSIISLTYQTFVEIRDGFSRRYGFSWGDFIADIFGSFMPYFQNNIDFIKELRFKISYYPSERFKHNSNRYIIDDYESTFDWISFPLNKLLPKKLRIFPSFLNIAFGHSVQGLESKFPRHRLFLSLDFNAEAIPLKGKFWKNFLRIINFYHFPAPAIQIYPGVIWYGLKF